jgi:acyl carrier protein
VGTREQGAQRYIAVVTTHVMAPEVPTLESQVVAVIAAKFNVADERTITPKTDLRRDLTSDSLALVELLLLLEGEFQVEIPDEEAQEITTVQQIVHYLALQMEPRAQRSQQRVYQCAPR